MFRFLHAADIHLDSPLRGLDQYEGAPVDRLRLATRHAFENLIQHALDHRFELVVIAGDLYDRELQDYATLLYLIENLARLDRAGIHTVIITGNHDGAVRFTDTLGHTLRLPPRAHVLASDHPQTITLDDLGVAIHGQSFAARHVGVDLSANYPPPRAGYFNIGLLHTSGEGNPEHAAYAPCRIAGLVGRGYDYWALGHVHAPTVVCEDPPIVYPGNLQGRHIRETGPKGCVVVTVADDHALTLAHQPLHVVRWERCSVDATGAGSALEVVDRFAAALESLLCDEADELLAVRVELSGTTAAHDDLVGNPVHWENQLRAAALTIADDVWLESVRFETSSLRDSSVDAGPLTAIRETIAAFEADPAALAGELDPLRVKLPASLCEGDDALDPTDPQRIRDALRLIEPLLRARLRRGGGPT